MTQLPRLNGKVTLQSHGIYPWILCHWITPKCSSQWNGVQSPWLSYPDSRSRSWDLTLNFVSAPYLLNTLNNFHLNSHNCSSQWDVVQSLSLAYADSRSHFKFMGFTIQFRARFISSGPFILFSLNFNQRSVISVRRCSQPLTQLPRLKTNVTLRCYGIYPSISFPRNISWTL